MPPLDIIINLHPQAAGNPLCVRRKGTAQLNPAPLPSGITIPVRLWFQYGEPDSQTARPMRVDEESIILQARCSPADPVEDELVVSTITWTEDSENGVYFYAADVGLSAPQLTTKLVELLTDLIFEVTLADLAGKPWKSSWLHQVRRAVTTDETPTALPFVPPYPQTPSDGTLLAGELVSGVVVWVKRTFAQVWTKTVTAVTAAQMRTDLSVESTTQLNARDTNNRARANHTGTQLAATISDFAATVIGTALTGLSLATSTTIGASDTILVAMGKLQAQISLRATLASPTFTGTPAAPTAAVDTNTTQLATTAFVLAQAAAATPAMNGTAAVGTSTRFARADHVHASDTSRVPTTRTISAAGLATGGGDLSANRTITVPKASAATVIAGTNDTDAVTALGHKAALDARFAALIEREGLRFYETSAAAVSIPALGTSDFTLVWLFKSNDQTNAQSIALGGVDSLAIQRSGTNWRVDKDNAAIIQSIADASYATGEIVVLGLTRSVSNWTFYKNGAVLSSFSSAGVDFTGAHTLLGGYGVGGNYTNGTISRLSLLNYALTQTEIHALINRGLVTLPEQRGGSTVGKLSGDNSTFTSSVGSWGADGGTITEVGGVGRIQGFAFLVGSFTKPGKKYRVTFDLVAATSAVIVQSPAQTVNVGSTLGAISVEVYGTNDPAYTRLSIYYANLSVGPLDIDNVQIYELGTLFELESGQRNAGYMLRDTSGNGRHVELPVSGVAIIDPDATGQITYTRTSDGYVIGDRVVIPTGYVIASVFATGDGTATLGESAGTPANVCTSVTLTSTAKQLPVLVATTSNGKLYIDLGTATTVTFTINLKKL